MRRRQVLAGLGTAAAAGVGVRWFATGPREGRVFWKRMAADTPEGPGALTVFTAWLADDGTVRSTVHPEYRDELGADLHVPERLHADLRERFGRGEPYYLVRARPHDCNGLPGDEGYPQKELPRRAFNDVDVGECVKR